MAELEIKVYHCIKDGLLFLLCLNCHLHFVGGLFLATGSTDHSVRVYNVAGFNGPAKILEREIHTVSFVY